MEFCELITVDRYHLGVPLSSEPKGTLSTFLHVAKILPLYVTFHGNFQTVRSEPELLIAPTEDRLFVFWFYTQWTNSTP
jgi:hypothetical protein